MGSHRFGHDWAHTVIFRNIYSLEHKISRKKARENLNIVSPFVES